MTEAKNNIDGPVGLCEEDIDLLFSSFNPRGLLRTGSELVLSVHTEHMNTIMDALISYVHWIPDEAGTNIVDGEPYVVFRWTDLRSDLDTWMWSDFEDTGLFSVLRDIPLKDFYMRFIVPLSVMDTDHVWIHEHGEGPSDMPEVMVPLETDRPKGREEQRALLTCTVFVGIPGCGPYWNDVLQELEYHGIDIDHSVPGIGVYALTDVDRSEDEEDDYPLTIYQIQTIIPFDSVSGLDWKVDLCTTGLRRIITRSRYPIENIRFSTELLPPAESQEDE